MTILNLPDAIQTIDDITNLTYNGRLSSEGSPAANVYQFIWVDRVTETPVTLIVDLNFGVRTIDIPDTAPQERVDFLQQQLDRRQTAKWDSEARRMFQSYQPLIGTSVRDVDTVGEFQRVIAAVTYLLGTIDNEGNFLHPRQWRTKINFPEDL